MKNNYSSAIADAINTFLKNDGWHFSFDEETGRFTFGLTLQCKLRNADYRIRVGEDSYTVYVYVPLKADDENLQTMSEFLHRANYGLKAGNFELDCDDGEIRYKIHVDSEDTVPTDAIIKNSIYTPAAMLDRYSEGILGILFRDETAEQAVERCEESPRKLIRSVMESGEEGESIRDKAKRLASFLGITDTDDETADGEDGEEAQEFSDFLDELLGEDDEDEEEAG